MCVCACVRAYVYVCMYMYMYVRTCMCMCTYMYDVCVSVPSLRADLQSLNLSSRVTAGCIMLSMQLRNMDLAVLAFSADSGLAGCHSNKSVPNLSSKQENL